MLRPVHLRKFLKNNNMLLITPKKGETLIIYNKEDLRKIILKTMNEHSNPMVESSSMFRTRKTKC